MRIEWFPGTQHRNYKDRGFYVMDYFGSIHADPLTEDEAKLMLDKAETQAQISAIGEEFIAEMEND